MAEEVKLLGAWVSPYSRRIELALKLKKVEYEMIDEDLSNKSGLLLEFNPIYAKVPVLIHKGKPILESQVILEYIDEAWPDRHPLMPKDPCERATARFWASFVDEKIVKNATSLVTATGEEKKGLLEKIGDHLKELENQLTDENFFGGDSIGFVDIVALFIVYYWQIQTVAEVPLFMEEKYPRMKKWLTKCCEIDNVREVLPPLDVLKSRLQPRLEILRASSRPAHR